MPIQINQNGTNLDMTAVSWNEINLIMLGLYTSKRVIENRVLNNPTDLNAPMDLRRIDNLINDINNQYPNWSGQAISLLDNTISDTLTSAGIRNNRITII
jgi:hypothetical protein